MAAELPKFAPINEGALMMTELKSQFYLFTTKKTVALAYGFIFVLFAFSIFLAFTPSPNSSSPWFSNIFSTTATIGSTSVGSYNESYGSHLTPLSPNSSHFTNISASGSLSPTAIKGSLNFNSSGESIFNKSSPFVNKSAELSDKAGDLEPNHTQILAPKVVNVDTLNATPKTSIPQVNYTSSDVKNKQKTEELHSKGEVFKGDQSASNSSSKSVSSGIISNKTTEEKGVIKNLTSSLARKKSNGTNSGTTRDDWIKPLVNCNLFDGKWVKDESYPLYKPGSCSLIDEQFNCFLNGRPDSGYQNLRWKPNGCTLPRLDGGRMLELLRGKRLVFVGDSLNRNMWESLICILRNSAKDQGKVYEASGRTYFRTEASYSFVFEDYKFTVEFFVSPFLVREWEFQSKDGTKKETLRLDLVGQSADKYKGADIIIFNTGHWWTHEKTSLGKDYYQEGSHVYSELNVLEAFRKAITTWARWVDANINPKRSLVFFRGYSPSHFSGGQWNSGGQCDHETEPIKNETYLSEYPSKMIVLDKVLRNMKTPVSYLNITRMSDYRKDGHPSMYRKLHLSEEERRSPLSYQDCSHWCLPGVPDAWNEILYAALLLKQYQKK